ncbi:hypothetical protein G4Z16_00590 [Streptomyces bathyalis]|uniref:PucR C-terminal helix-turn-helix domain-containing protein n=1 Tax=Streptomyces bathyalis TaxID=2710756 RepID=A0A7T1T2H0_9ACTN|nr:hypothetical protein [Streptomyces bathyalis]QPP05133.1 hypothetical protein G4Z16_00590 [Streptomyces bathyalis]
MLLEADPSLPPATQQHRTVRLLAHLVREQATGIVAMNEASQLALLASGDRLPLFVPRRPCTGLELQSQLLRAQLRAERSAHARTEALLKLASRLDRQGEGPQEVLRMVRQETGATVRIIDVDADEENPSDQEIPPHLLKLVASGQADSATDDTEGHLLLHALGGGYPRPVLAAESTVPWTPAQHAFVATAALHVSLLRQPLALRAQQQRLAETASAMREAALLALLRGTLAQARLSLKGLGLDLLDHPWMQFGVLRCPAGEDRVNLREECSRLLSRSALVAPCPAEPDDLLILRGLDSAEADTGTAQLLLPLVTARPGRMLGLSQPQPWERTAHVYNSAVNALSQTTPQRPFATDAGAPCISQQLPAWASLWAAGVLKSKLGSLAQEDRESLLEISYRALTIGTKQTAGLLNTQEQESDPLHRNTVSAQLTRLSGLLGLGSSRRDRALLHFLLDVASHAPQSAAIAGGPKNPTLSDVLATPEARSAAHQVIAPLETRQNTYLLKTLIVRATSDSVDEAADTLGITRRALQKRLTIIGTTIGRQMSGPPWGWLHEVILALVIAGHVSQDLLTDPSLPSAPASRHDPAA